MPSLGDRVVTVWVRFPGTLHAPEPIPGEQKCCAPSQPTRSLLHRCRTVRGMAGIRDRGSGFTVHFPGDPTVEAAAYKAADGRSFSAHVFSVKQGAGVFKVTVVDMPGKQTGSDAAVMKEAAKVVTNGSTIKFDIPHRVSLCENSTRYKRAPNFEACGRAQSKKSKNSSSARHYDQIRFRFRTAWARIGSHDSRPGRLLSGVDLPHSANSPGGRLAPMSSGVRF
jgi:hypothetical protein